MTVVLTAERVAELAELADNVTASDWHVDEGTLVDFFGNQVLVRRSDCTPSNANIVFVCEAREGVAALCASHEALRVQTIQLEAIHVTDVSLWAVKCDRQHARICELEREILRMEREGPP